MLTTKQLLGMTPKDAIAAMLNDINRGNPLADPPVPKLFLSGKDILVSAPTALTGRLTQVQVQMRPLYSPIDYVPYDGSVTFTYNRMNINTFASLAFVNYNLSLPATTLDVLAHLELLFGFPFDPIDFVVEGITNPGQYLLKAQTNSLRWVGNYQIDLRTGNALFVIGDPPNAVLNVAYSFQYVAEGGLSPYTWSATGLPFGLSMDSLTGTISGITSVLGVHNVTVTVLDSQGTQLQVGFNLDVGTPVVGPVNAPITFSETYPSATVGVAYQQDLLISGGDGVYTSPVLTQGTLPAGLALSLVVISNKTYLRLSGTPTATYFGLMAPTVTGGDGQVKAQPQQFVVLTPMSVSGTYVDAPTGIPYVDALALQGGSGDYFLPAFYNVSLLPPGIDTLLVNNGMLEIRGTPTTPGTYTFPVTVQTGYGQSLSVTLGLTVV
jgi:hypothetical protein